MLTVVLLPGFVEEHVYLWPLSNTFCSLGLISAGFTLILVHGRFEDKVASTFSERHVISQGIYVAVCVGGDMHKGDCIRISLKRVWNLHKHCHFPSLKGLCHFCSCPCTDHFLLLLFLHTRIRVYTGVSISVSSQWGSNQDCLPKTVPFSTTPRSVLTCIFPPFYDLQDSNVLKSLCHGVPTTANTGWHKKNRNFWKTQQKLKKSKKKNLLTEIEPLQLAF